jgi:hypothetical protein
LAASPVGRSGVEDGVEDVEVIAFAVGEGGRAPFGRAFIRDSAVAG